MRTSTFAIVSLFAVLLLHAVSWATCDSVNEPFLQCLENHSNPSDPISAVFYTPNNSSYSSVLQAYIRNLRFNESTTPKPQLIITALHESHIQAAIICAKRIGLEMRIRSGGHDFEGISYSSVNPFFILDMFNLRSINVSIADATAWVQVGATLGEVYYRIAEKSNTHGFPAGVCPTVGVGGHFSGGGYGNMMRKYGLTVDNIVDAQIIDVNGRILNRESMGEDLFWAITGGGASSYGVVLAYKIKLVVVPAIVTVFQVNVTLQQNATNIVYRWQQVADKLDEDIYIRLSMHVVNVSSKSEEKTITNAFISLFLGDSKRLLSLMNQSFPELGLKQTDCIEMTWAQSILYWTGFPIGTPVNTLLSRIPQPLTHTKLKSDYLKEPIPKDGLEYIWKRMIELERPVLAFNPYGGKMVEIPASDKPFPHRAGNIYETLKQPELSAPQQKASTLSSLSLTTWSEDGVEAANHYLNLTRMLHGYMTPYVSKSPREAFLNYRDLDLGINHNGPNSYTEGAVYGIQYFKDNYHRLVQTKTKVDPHNFFRNEQSIPTLPSSRK